MSAPPAGPLLERLRGPAEPYVRWWRGAGRRERVAGTLVGLVVALLTGAFLFGAVHVVVGGFIKGNWRAGWFGVGLSVATGFVLAVGHLRVSPRFRR